MKNAYFYEVRVFGTVTELDQNPATAQKAFDESKQGHGNVQLIEYDAVSNTRKLLKRK